MAIRRIYRQPQETARHRQLKQICLDYFTAYEKLMKHPSMANAARARKACVRMKQVAHHRGIELLDLYATSRNTERPEIYPTKHWPQTIAKRKQEETNNEEIR